MQLVLDGAIKNSGIWAKYKSEAEQFICSCVQKGNNNVKKTTAGLLWFLPWNNLQYTATASFISAVYADYLIPKHASLHCLGGFVQASDLISLARSQVH